MEKLTPTDDADQTMQTMQSARLSFQTRSRARSVRGAGVFPPVQAVQARRNRALSDRFGRGRGRGRKIIQQGGRIIR